MEECRVVAINNLISYISPTENPLSANVVMIQGKDALWLYDVGNHPDIPAIIDTYSNGRKVNAILSHFHAARASQMQSCPSFGRFLPPSSDWSTSSPPWRRTCRTCGLYWRSS